MSAALTALGVDHVAIGFPEAYGEALSTMATMVTFSAKKTSWDDVRYRLAVVMAANERATAVPMIAQRLVKGGDLPPALVAALQQLRGSLENAANFTDAVA